MEGSKQNALKLAALSDFCLMLQDEAGRVTRRAAPRQCPIGAVRPCARIAVTPAASPASCLKPTSYARVGRAVHAMDDTVAMSRLVEHGTARAGGAADRPSAWVFEKKMRD